MIGGVTALIGRLAGAAGPDWPNIEAIKIQRIGSAIFCDERSFQQQVRSGDIVEYIL